MTKQTFSVLSIMTMAATLLSGCEVIGGIFKAGLWAGIIVVVIVVAIVIWIIRKFFSRRD